MSIKSTKPVSRLALESLEDRLAMSTFDIVNGVLIYEGTGVANNLTITRSGNDYTLTDTAELIQKGTVLSNSFTISGSGFTSIRVNVNDGDDVVTLQGIDKPTTVDGGKGSDTFNVGSAVGLETTTAAITVKGGTDDAGSTDVLNVNDQGAPNTLASVPVIGGINVPLPTRLTYSIADGVVTRQRLNALGAPASAKLTLKSEDIESIDLNASNQGDAISIGAVAANTEVEVNAGGGNDAITFGKSMDLVKGKLTVRGQAGTDTLTIDDRDATTDRTYEVNTASVKQGDSQIGVTTLEGLTIQAPNKENTFDVLSASVAMALTFTGGTGKDTVKISDAAVALAQTYTFTAGKVERATQFSQVPLPSAVVNYSGVESLAVNGGKAADTFKVNAVTAQTPLALNGGQGTDTVDFSAFTTGVEANLTLGSAVTKAGAASVVSKLAAIENATGGSGSDILVGDANANTLRGNAGRDLIIGGKGGDTLFGGLGQDLMIASDTAFDLNAASLRSIRTAWDRTDLNYDQRRNLLKNTGVGIGNAIKLNETTVRVGAANDDKAKDTLHSKDNNVFVPGGGDQDWFWANLGNLATNDTILNRVLSGSFFEENK